MNKSKTLDFLIDTLKSEDTQFKSLKIPEDLEQKKTVFRNLLTNR